MESLNKTVPVILVSYNAVLAKIQLMTVKHVQIQIEISLIFVGVNLLISKMGKMFYVENANISVKNVRRWKIIV